MELNINVETKIVVDLQELVVNETDFNINDYRELGYATGHDMMNLIHYIEANQINASDNEELIEAIEYVTEVQLGLDMTNTLFRLR